MSRKNHPSRRICRNLFGPVNHRALAKEIESKLKAIAHINAAKAQLYNFDFLHEKPLKGRLKWKYVKHLSLNC
jgi:predicted short-subunit dehydrogenase-like oxidoreductase (DUF2520 family)